MNERTLLIAALVVAVVLPGIMLAGPTFHPQTPYQYNSPDYAVAHESTDAFEETADDVSFSEPTPVSELPATTQRAFHEATAEAADSSDGWQRLEIDICRDDMLVCTAYEEPPSLPDTVTVHPDSKTTIEYTLVEHEDDRYVAAVEYNSQTGFAAIPIFLLGVFTFAVFVLYSLVLVLVARHYRQSRPRLVLAYTGLGLLLAAWPYPGMLTGGRLSATHVPIPAICGLLYGIYLYASR
ncbi:hypothetical protein [Natronobacterium texcoconense]|uniref:Uncharacterized protein n=1 Tax=Natronobacterium texcoconense TaxID=1095778 RepID=A0A1H1J1N4_NATTX|nr:hypothetical protein [Natronobacterium texcoconense]SDR43894.1 hypothetical protein SAMN04489842_4022 [Natronobacterium texcoconense]